MKWDALLVGSAIGLLLISAIRHPGGWLITIALIAVLLLLWGLLRFIPEYILVTNQGKHANKSQRRRQRRARGLTQYIPFVGSSRGQRRQGGQRQGQQGRSNGGQNRGGGDGRA